MVDLTKINDAMAKAIAADIKSSSKTLEEIAEHAGVSKAAVGKWKKTGQITTGNLILLADCLRVPVAKYLSIYCSFDPRDNGAVNYDSDVEASAAKALISGLSERDKIEMAKLLLEDFLNNQG